MENFNPEEVFYTNTVSEALVDVLYTTSGSDPEAYALMVYPDGDRRGSAFTNRDVKTLNFIFSRVGASKPQEALTPTGNLQPTPRFSRTSCAYSEVSNPTHWGVDMAAESIEEKDPHGKALNEPGAKADQGKVRVGLMEKGFANALFRVAAVATDGADKYSPNGWVQVPSGQERYEDAAGRHRLARYRGQELDPNSESYHLAHEIWNLLAVFELRLREVNKWSAEHEFY